ncbi:MAG: T9SS type A sorting domain-containing protein [Bacteroidales bacterium]|nr:T9SS type A sorting domain-containing protein [Bacteroidales bacterium]HQP03151.1 T9SS type A sorting domain-containing protein [Bacteroidales bacterium]
MKRIPLVLFVFVLMLQAALLYSQNRELSQQEQQQLMSYPELKMPESYKNKSIPYMVDNSQLEYFRPMFSQAGMSCGQASSTGILFTYEMNRARDVAANVNEHLYPTHFVYDWAAGDWGSNGVSYYHTLEVLRTVGTPNQEEYGGTIDAGGNLRWMTGYDLYYSAMHNRVNSVYCIKNLNTAAGIQTLKNWMNDHMDGSEHGGCAIFYSTVPYPDANLPAGTEEAGKYVITELYAGTSHSMALLGYNDSIRYDYNGDGQYTNNLDINNDGVVNVNDWEIGGFKMCNTYSGGPSWADGGFCYLTYKAVAGGAFWNAVVHVMYINPTYEPTLTIKSTVTYDKRKRIKIVAGMTTDLLSTVPEYYIDFPIFDFQGGERYMTGGTAEIDKTLEFGLDITAFLNYLQPGQQAKFFLKVMENDVEAYGNGQINSFSVIDYSSGTASETICPQTNVTITNNTATAVSLTKTVNHHPPELDDDFLPPGAILSDYSHTLTASSGTPPYTFSFDTEYDIHSSTGTFPTGGSSLSISGFTAVNPGFSFPFAGSTYSTIYVSNTGLIVFQSGFSTSLPYNVDDDIVFAHAKCIAPYYNAGITSTVKKQTGSGWIILTFDNSVLDYSVKLFENGDIEFIYQNNAMSASSIYSIGVSQGDIRNVQRLIFPNQTNIPNGFSYYLTARQAPTEFQLSPEGVLTGIPTQEYVSEDFYFKVTDNHNLIDRKTLPFVTDGLIMQFIPHTPDDDIPEYNETVDIEITATNPMTSAVTGISVTMTSADSYIIITDANATLPNINPGANTNLLNALQFQINANTPDQHTALFNFSVSSDQDTWNYAKTFTVNSPKIQPGDVTITDGNDNVLGAGENATVTVEIFNSGHAPASHINISLSTSDPYLTLNSDPADIANLAASGMAESSFSVSAASIIPETHIAVITMQVVADNGYTCSESFEVTIHTPVITAGSLTVNDGSNFCLDAGETTEINIPLNNVGQISAHNVVAQLSTYDEFVTINEATYSTPSINFGESAISSFNISVSSDAPLAHYVVFNLHITAADGFDVTIQVATIVGLMIENFESGDLTLFDWITTAPAPWFITTEEPYEGSYCLRSGDINDSQSTTLSIENTVVVEGDISFYYKVSSENYYDFLEFLIDNVVIASWSGTHPWSQYNYTVATGTHTFAWRYRKDGSISNNSDCAWIDYIVFPAVNGLPPVFALEPASVEKWMYSDETDTDTILISNAGGGIIDYTVGVDFIDVKSTKNITGSTLTCNTNSFMAGGTYDFVFTAHNASNDSEWLKSITIDFPAGFIVNSYTDFIGGSGGNLISTDPVGDGASVTWTTANQWGVIYDGESAVVTVNVTISSGFGNMLADIDYTLTGDIYGAEPHTLEGVILMANQGNFWLTVIPFSGQLLSQSETELYLNFNTEGMDNGYYYANLSITHNNEVSVVPITLHIVTVDVPESVQENVQIYPNPFSNTVYINTANLTEPIHRIEITDVQGRLLYVCSNREISANGNCIWLNTQGFISSTGIYFVKIVMEQKTEIYKLIKE